MQENLRGISVTRHDVECFSVGLSDAVPVGIIRELRVS